MNDAVLGRAVVTTSTGAAMGSSSAIMVWRTAALVLLLLLCLAQVACENRVVDAVSGWEKLAMPTELIFDAVDVEETIEQWLKIENTGEVEITVERLEIYRRGSRYDSGFFETDFASPVAIAPKETVSIRFTYTSLGFGVATASVLLVTDAGDYEVELRATLPSARLEWIPYADLFSGVPNGECQTSVLALINAGQVAIEVDEIMLDRQSFEFTIAPESLQELPFTLPVAGLGDPPVEFPIAVEFCPQAGGSAIGELIVRWDHSDRVSEESIIRLGRDPLDPCLGVRTPESGDQGLQVAFTEVLLGTTSTQSFALTNCAFGEGAQNLEVSSIDLVAIGGGALSDAFSLVATPSLPLSIAPGESVEMGVQFAPSQTAVPDEGAIEIVSNSGTGAVVQLPVIGLATENLCPVATAGCRLSGSSQEPSNTVGGLRPRAVLQCRDAGSNDPDGNVVRWEWSVESAPDGANVAISDAESPEMEVQLDVQGRYQFLLNVLDDEGRRSCSAASVVAHAEYSEGFSAELVWSTPGDPNPADEGEGSGADLDLRVLSALDGCWEDDEWDCSVDNPELNWGNSASAVDDAAVQVTDSDTGGPENITIEEPADGVYRVGVLYRNDHGFGPSDAIVRVYLHGVLMVEQTRRLTASGEFWDVADIELPSCEVSVRDEVWPSPADATCP